MRVDLILRRCRSLLLPIAMKSGPEQIEMLGRLRRSVWFFVPVWMFPIVAVVESDFEGETTSLVIPIIYLCCSGISLIPYYAKRVKPSESILFMTVPTFAVWVGCVMVNQAVLVAIGKASLSDLLR